MNPRRRLRDERGAAVTVWVVLTVTILTLIVGIAVDLSGQVRAKRHASDIAAQAARAAGQSIDADQLLGSGRVDLVASAARRAAMDYIEHADMTGQVTITADSRITVTTTATYTPVFLSSIGVGDLSVTGEATVRTVRALDGTER